MRHKRRFNDSPRRWFAAEWCQTSLPAVRSHSRLAAPRCCNLPASDSISVSRGARKGSLRQRMKKIECQSELSLCYSGGCELQIIATLVKAYLRRNTRGKILAARRQQVFFLGKKKHDKRRFNYFWYNRQDKQCPKHFFALCVRSQVVDSLRQKAIIHEALDRNYMCTFLVCLNIDVHKSD